MSFNKMRKFAALLLAGVTMASTASCSADLSSTAEESRTYMTVGEFDVPTEMYTYKYSVKMYGRLLTEGVDKEKAEALDDSSLTEAKQNEIASEVYKMATEEIISMYSVFGVAKDKGIDPFGDRINELTDMKMEENRAAYGSDKAYLKDLKKYHMTDNVYSLLTRYEIVSDQLYSKLVETGSIKTSDEDVIAYMTSDNGIRLKQILISFERHTEDEAKKLADDVYAQLSTHISEDGYVDEAQFDLLTDKYGEDLTMFKNRDGYYTYRGYRDEVFEATGFSLDVGQVAKPVRIYGTGYSIIMRAEKDPGFIKDNVGDLKDGCLNGVYNSIIIEYMNDVEVTYIK